MAANAKDADDITLYRTERFLDLGFDTEDASTLAEAKDTNGFLLYWGDVRKFLFKGASKEQIIAIYT